MTILALLDKLTGQKAVFPWWLCFTFDNPLRKLFHDPYAILAPHVHSGDNVIDIGCGMGYFTIPLAKLAGPEGHITAIDIQEKMLAAFSCSGCSMKYLTSVPCSSRSGTF